NACANAASTARASAAPRASAAAEAGRPVRRRGDADGADNRLQQGRGELGFGLRYAGRGVQERLRRIAEAAAQTGRPRDDDLCADQVTSPLRCHPGSRPRRLSAIAQTQAVALASTSQT